MNNPNNFSVPTLALHHDVGYWLYSSASFPDSNTTRVGVLVPPLPEYISPSPNLVQTAIQVAASGQQVNWSSPCGTNCTYTISFVGPTYSCVNTSGPIPPDLFNLTTYPENQAYLADWGNDLEYGPEASLYWSAQYWSDLADASNTTPADGGNIGFWLIYYTLPTPLPSPLEGAVGLNLDFHVVQCNISSANYTIDISFMNNIPTLHTTVVPLQSVTSGFLNAGQEIAGLDPLNTPEAILSMNLLMIHESLMHIFIGYIENSYLTIAPMLQFSRQTLITSFKGAVNNIDINGTTLPSFADDLLTKTVDLLTNVTVSLVGGGTNTGTSPRLTPGTETPWLAIYQYNPAKLWVPYGVALGLSAILGVIGIYMLAVNKFAGTTAFMPILLATRNPTLDKLAEGASVGVYVPETLRNSRLKFGKLHGTEHLSFGLESEVGEIGR